MQCQAKPSLLQVKCPECGFVSRTSHPFLALELEISRSSSLTQALQQHTAQERLDASNMWRCDKHKGMVQASKQLLLGRLPPVLILSLKRFSTQSRGRKLSKQVILHVRQGRVILYMAVCWFNVCLPGLGSLPASMARLLSACRALAGNCTANLRHSIMWTLLE